LFGDEDFGDGDGVAGDGPESVDRFSRKGDQTTVVEDRCGTLERGE
jgi:hypothetical protein